MIAAVALPARSAERWSLDSCVSYAVEYNVEVCQRMLAMRQAELAVTEAKDRVLPNLGGYAQQSFSFGRGLTADNTYANRNTNSFAVGAQLSLPLFQGLKVVRGIDYSNVSLRAAVERSEAIRDDVEVNVMAQYLQALYARENLAVARMSLRVSQDELLRREALLEAGKIPELDLCEARAQVSRDELQVTTAANDSVLALLDLANLLNLESAEGFDIVPLEDEGCQAIPSVDEVWSNMLLCNHTLRAADMEHEAAEKYVGVAKAGYLPTLNFSAGIGTNYYRTSGFINEGFGPQMRHNFSKSLGFSLNIPIFDAFSTRNSVTRARLQQVDADLQRENTRRQLRTTITNAHAQALAAQRREETASVAEEATKTAFEAMQVKYDSGRANATEFEKAKAEYINAVSQRLQAAFERMLRIRILRHYGRLQ